MEAAGPPAFYALLTSTEARIAYVLVPLALIFAVEAMSPLYAYGKGHVLRRSLPNLAIAAVVVGVNLLLDPVSPHVATLAAEGNVGLLNWLHPSPLLALVVGIIALDLFAYLAHVTMHRIPFMWRFHRVHHSDNELDVTTTFRQHPGEVLWRVAWQIAAMFAFGLPIWVVVAYATLSSVNGQLKHANARVPGRLDRLLRIVLVTPNMHKLHHARELPETDMNYAEVLSIWDRLGRTYNSGPRFEELRYGLAGFDERDRQSVVGMLRTPFMTSWGARRPDQPQPLAETGDG